MSEEIEKLAKLMHDTYEDKAREFGWSTQEKTRVAFRDLPESNKRTMLAVAEVVYATTRREAVEEFITYFVSTVKPAEQEENPMYIKFLDLIQAEIDYFNSLEKGTNNE